MIAGAAWANIVGIADDSTTEDEALGSSRSTAGVSLGGDEAVRAFDLTLRENIGILETREWG